MASLTDELKTRGLIEGEGGGTLKDILSKKRSVYLGIDPTADSLHVGNLVPIILMKHLKDAGHKLYFIVGGGTGLIGDPRESGERTLLDTKVAKANVKAISAQLTALFGSKSFTLLNNEAWLLKLPTIAFLRDVGKHFTINQLIKKELVKKRLENEDESISYTEFSYTLLQAYDYLVLNEKYGVDLQVGGSDQWTNILPGIDLIRKRLGASAYALTTPIIVDRSTGKKFGKSEGNAVWLDAKKTSPFAFYQFWLNVADENLSEYLRIFTFLSLSKIESALKTHASAPHKRLGQKLLALEVTGFIHGKDTAEAVERVASFLFGGESITSLSPKDRMLLLKEAPSVAFDAHVLSKGIPAVEVLVSAGLAESKGDARRLLGGNAVSISSRGTLLPDAIISIDDFEHGTALLRKGKKVSMLVVTGAK